MQQEAKKVITEKFVKDKVTHEKYFIALLCDLILHIFNVNN